MKVDNTEIREEVQWLAREIEIELKKSEDQNESTDLLSLCEDMHVRAKEMDASVLGCIDGKELIPFCVIDAATHMARLTILLKKHFFSGGEKKCL